MGLIPLPKLAFGYEGAGIVRRVGPGTKKLIVGDRVFMMGVKAFATVATGARSSLRILASLMVPLCPRLS